MSLSKNILATVVYYDVMDYPLTSFEIWKHLITLEEEDAKLRPDLFEVYRALEGEMLLKKLIVVNGFYVLPGREELVQSRIQNEKMSVSKLKRVKGLVYFLGWVPFLRMIGVTGSLAMKAADPKSDWDFFVVLKSGSIWTGRTILTALLHIIGKRRHGKKVCDRACLNYYVTENNLGILTKDLFSAHEYSFALPIFGVATFRKFEVANRWISRFKPAYVPTQLLPLWTVRPGRWMRSVRGILESLFGSAALERALSRWQKVKIFRNPKTRWEGGLIEANDTALIFLPRPNGPRVFVRFKARWSEQSVV